MGLAPATSASRSHAQWAHWVMCLQWTSAGNAGLAAGQARAPNAPENVSLHQGAASQLPLPDHSVHMILYANIWHEIEDLDSNFAKPVRSK